MPKKSKKSAKKEEEKPVEEEANEPEPEPEPQPQEPTEEEKQREIELKLQDPENNDDIVLDFELESPSQKMQKYLVNRKEEYINAHKQFKENKIKINKQCNEKISIIANNVRYQIQTSDKIFQDILSIFTNEQKLKNMSDETDVDECWEMINKEFTERQSLIDNFNTKSHKIENERESSMQTEIQNLFQLCINTGLLPPHKIEKSLQPKINALTQLIADKTKFYHELISRLKENDSNLKPKYEDQYRDGKLRWNQLHRKPQENKENEALQNVEQKSEDKQENENIPNEADEKS